MGHDTVIANRYSSHVHNQEMRFFNGSSNTFTVKNQTTKWTEATYYDHAFKKYLQVSIITGCRL